METGICRRCACNWVTPCINEKDTEMSLYNLPEVYLKLFKK